MELLAEYNVALINHPAEELDQDIENAQRHPPAGGTPAVSFFSKEVWHI